MIKTLCELGEEYEAAAECVKIRIEKKRKQLRELKNEMTSNDAYEVKRELKVLYEEHRLTRQIADYLKTYYESNGKEIFAYK